MSYVYLRFESLQKRFDEIDLLLNHASENEDNEELYYTLCRSAQIFLVAHFEGAIKNLTRDVLDDLNNSGGKFKDSPKAIKYTFCTHFIEDNKGHCDSDKVSILIETLDPLPMNYHVSPFLYKENKNPSPTVVDKIMEKFGVDYFLSRIYHSDLDVVFQDSVSDAMNLKEKLKQHLKETVEFYPYKVDISLFHISSEKCKKEDTLWHTFLNTILTNRHNIVHGDKLESLDSHVNIQKSKLKVEILIYAYILVLCNCALPSK